MKTTIKLLVVLALALATFSQHSSASAGGVFKFKGKGASASFSSADPSGCVVTDVFVAAGEANLSEPSRPRKRVPRGCPVYFPIRLLYGYTTACC